MITVKYKKNIDIDRALRNVRTAASVLLNDIAIPVKEGWDNALQTGDFSNNYKNKSTQDLHGGTPLNVSGKLAKSNKILRASPKKLKAVVKNTAKSSTNYKIRKPNGKIYRGKRKSAPVFYGYHLKKGFQTAPNSLVPNRKVPKRDFTSKTVDTLFQNPKCIKAKKKFAKNLETSMRMAAK
jgi:hypothetical protein